MKDDSKCDEFEIIIAQVQQWINPGGDDEFNQENRGGLAIKITLHSLEENSEHFFK